MSANDKDGEAPSDKPGRLALALNVLVAAVLLGTPIVLVYLFVTIVFAGALQQGGWPWPAAIAAGAVLVIVVVVWRYFLRRGRFMGFGVPHRTSASSGRRKA